jgi:actin-related protein
MLYLLDIINAIAAFARRLIDRWQQLFLCPQPTPIDVQVITHQMQRYAVWFGGSMLATTVSVLFEQLGLYTQVEWYSFPDEVLL